MALWLSRALAESMLAEPEVRGLLAMTLIDDAPRRPVRGRGARAAHGQDLRGWDARAERAEYERALGLARADPTRRFLRHRVAE